MLALDPPVSGSSTFTQVWGCADPVTPDAAWDLTRRICPRSHVRVADRMAGGGVSGTYRATRPLTQTVPDGPWAVPLAGDDLEFVLVCLDLDAGGDEAVAALTPHLDALDIPHVVTASGGPGHRHIWWAMAPGHALPPDTARLLATSARRVAPSLDITPLCNPRSGCVRPPGAPHATGTHSTILTGTLDALTTPTVTGGQVGNLIASLSAAGGLTPADTTAPTPATATVAHDADGHPYLTGTRRPLCSSATTALQQDLAAGQDASPIAWTVLIGAVRARWHLSDLYPHLAAAGLEHVRTRPAPGGRTPRSRAEQARVLAADWARAVADVAATGTVTTSDDAELTARASRVVATVTRLRDKAAASPGRWQQRSGASDRRVLTVVLATCLHALRLDVSLDVRSIALQAGIGRQTAADALVRLTDDGWLHSTDPAGDGRGTTWNLGPQPVDQGRENTTRELSTDFQHQTWTHRPHRAGHSTPTPHDQPSPALNPDLIWTTRGHLLTDLTSWLDHARHDTFTTTSTTPDGSRWCGLGLHAGNVYADTQTLAGRDQQPVTATNLTPGHDGPARTHVARHLTHLARAGLLRLVDSAGGPRVTCYRRDRRDTAAAHLGVAGVLTARAARYRIERDAWTWWTAELAYMTTQPRHRWRRPPHLAQPALITAPTRIWPPHPRTGGRADWAQARRQLTSRYGAAA